MHMHAHITKAAKFTSLLLIKFNYRFKIWILTRQLLPANLYLYVFKLNICTTVTQKIPFKFKISIHIFIKMDKENENMNTNYHPRKS